MAQPNNNSVRKKRQRLTNSICRENGFTKDDVRRYQAVMLTFTKWSDQAWYDSIGGRPRSRNVVFERVRNTSYHDVNGKQYFKPLCSKPNQLELLAHLVHNRKEDTLFFINTLGKDRILVNWDIDPEGHATSLEGSKRSQALAELVERRYCFGRGLIDPSPGGSGRHVYQVFDVRHPTEWGKLIPVNEVIDTLAEWERRVKAEPEVASFVGANLCCLRGEPTNWDWTPDGGYELVRRGSVVKAPYLQNFDVDIERLENLPAIKLSIIQRYLRNHPQNRSKHSSSIHPPSSPITYMGRTPTPPDIAELNGREKKRVCIKQMSSKLGRPVTADEAFDEYEANWQPTGFGTADRKRRLKQIDELCDFYAETFKKTKGSPYSFKPGHYLQLVKDTVPASDFKWERREKLDHQRLADFVGIKIQDAFFEKEDPKYAARATRNATIANTRILKEKGLIGWIATTNIYQRLLDIAVRHQLLDIYDEFRRPYRTKLTGIALNVGAARMIGPGEALEEEYEAFQKLMTKSLPMEGNK